ncbi:UDP-N-acetylmuramate dehydrogenase [Candidatus Falkowbacteria bacterium]|nr:UDP-N-acetylmuramate dehydrogenase [Candidatus Falkowbacteria bacterium]NCT54645.1 UDP-N-acetylmuramate dehydrogenase [Candidatus Falkowbacteria bacterium]
MLKIFKKHDLAPYLTMKVGAKAEYFAVLKNKADFFEALDFAKKKSLPIFILGGGSNTVIVKNIKALVLKNKIEGKKIKKENSREIYLEVMSGESWMRLVNYSVSQGFYGLENLASIYGTVGAAPIQNIGAYGAEFSQVFDSLIAYDLKTGREKIFSAKECELGYRDSIFKRKAKGKYFIYSLVLKLKKKAKLNLSYGAIGEEMKKRGIKNPEPKDVAQVVHQIRSSKLPNPAVLPNSGSFFKNPEIKNSVFLNLQKTYPEIPFFTSAKKGMIKIPAGWLIEKAGFKGKVFGPVGMYEWQALILVNYGGAKAWDIVKMIERVKKEVKKRFAIDLEAEVNII